MSVFVNILIVAATFFTMEFVAWFTHKYIMHGLLWNLHRDHHQVDRSTFFERNDAFFLIFAVPGILLLVTGGDANFDFRFWIGLGITLYGMAYFFVHDIFIHQRFKVLRNADSVYFRAIRKAHKVHHKHLGKEDGECFGMLLVPMKYFKEAQRIVSKL
ncbi:MAG: beta-carotene hydroxylase [Saprospiraceae bacterium]